MSERFTTPVGRYVQGDVWELQTTDMQGNPLVVKNGPNKGKTAHKYFFGIAISKRDPLWPAYYATLDRVARADWPQFFPVPGGPCSHPEFAWKVIDGDGIVRKGKNAGQRYADREGFAGCWIVRFERNADFGPIKIYHAGMLQPGQEVWDKAALKRGEYIRVNGSTKGNGNPENPGLYVNVDMIEISYKGQEIVTGPTATDAFGQAAPPPPGYAPPSDLPPNYVSPGGHAAAPAPPSTVFAPAAAPAPTPPYDGYMAAPPPAPPAPAAPPPPPPPPPPPAGPQLTPAGVAAGGTYAAFQGQGWTDEQLRAAGYLA